MGGRGCVFGCCGSKYRRRFAQLGYGIDDDYYRGERCGCVGPRGRLDLLEAFGNYRGYRTRNAMNTFEQFNFDFDQLFVGWGYNYPRCGSRRRCIR